MNELATVHNYMELVLQFFHGYCGFPIAIPLTYTLIAGMIINSVSTFEEAIILIWEEIGAWPPTIKV